MRHEEPQPERKERAGLRHTLGPWWRVLRMAYLRFGFGGSYVLAAAVAFYALVCLGPLGILLAAGLQFVFGSGTASYRWLEAAAQELAGPTASEIMSEVNTLLANPGVHVATALSVVLLIWAGLRLFETVERSLTEVWPGRVLRGFLGRKFISLLMMLVAGVLLAGFVLVQVFLASARGWIEQFPQVDPSAVDLLRPRFLLVVQFVMSVFAFALVYKFVPVQWVAWRTALRGGLCAAVLWHAASPIFTYVFSRSQQQDSFYGGLSGVVIFSLWAFLGAQILLFGAHFAAAYDHVFVKQRPRAADDAVIGWPGRRRSAEEPPPEER